jgi:hypothetical protein
MLLTERLRDTTKAAGTAALGSSETETAEMAVAHAAFWFPPPNFQWPLALWGAEEKVDGINWSAPVLCHAVSVPCELTRTRRG